MKPAVIRALTAVFLTCTVFVALQADAPPPPAGPKSPREALATFRLHPGFRIELVACEPQVMDPVAMAFDHDGRLYVAEMRGYPNGGFGTGDITSGSIKLLSDRDGDGEYETATTFASGLRFPMSIQPWKKGILVSVAPDVIYLEDTNGDGKADVQRVLYTGFGVDNIQQLINGLHWGLDNWVYGNNGASGGTIVSKETPDAAPIALGNRGIRFKPDIPGSLEPTSGGGQYGMTFDMGQHCFVNTNSQHIRQVVLPEQYLRRNPGLAPPAATIDIPEHGPACKVFRISPFESWRVERTTRRAGGPDAGRFAKTELVPGGYSTSSCSPTLYLADRFPRDYHGSVFICEPANNLVFRDRIVENGPIYKAVRADSEQEFLASTDNWFRPVNLTIGPDGALYVVDFYREVIETPRSLPDDMKPKLVLKTQERGRIWRVAPTDRVLTRKPNLSPEPARDLVPLLDDANIWWRINAQRLLVERQDKSVVPDLVKLAAESRHDFGRIHALQTLHGLNSLPEDLIMRVLGDSSAFVREHGLRLAESRAASSALRKLVAQAAGDPVPRVRMQAAFSLGAFDGPEMTAALTGLIRRDAGDPWITAAVLSSCRHVGASLLAQLLKDPNFARPDQLAVRRVAGRLMSQVGATGPDARIAEALTAIADLDSLEGREELLASLGQGMQNTARPLSRVWANPSSDLKPAIDRLRPTFDRAARTARSDNESVANRLTAIRLLAQGPPNVALDALKLVFSAQHPDAVQQAAVRALAVHEGSGVAPVLIEAWGSASPALRREIQEALFARPDRLPVVVQALEAKTILPQQLDGPRIVQLQKLPNAELRARAAKALVGAIDADRQKVIESFKNVLDLKADVDAGRASFRKTCATCHRLENTGTEVGPDLLAALRDKTPEQLLVSILDPSREVDRRYTNYLVETKAGRTITGMIAAETATSITLRRAEKAEDSVLRAQIDSITDTAKSLMPDGLEKDLKPQELANIIGYLRAVK